MDNVITKRCWKQSHGCPWQSCKATNHTVTLRNLPNLASGTYTSTHRNSPEPSAGTYTSTHRNSPEPSGTYFPNLHQHTSELSGTVRNLPQPASGTYTSTHQNSPEPSGTCNLPRNLHQHTPELSGTFRNLQPSTEPTPAHTGTLRNLPEPSGTYTSNTPELSGTFRNLLPEPTPAHTGTFRNHQHTPELSGTCLRNLHQHTPELSGTFRNLPPEPAPATRTGTHRSLSGLKTPLAYAVGKKKRIKKETKTTLFKKKIQYHLKNMLKYVKRCLKFSKNVCFGRLPSSHVSQIIPFGRFSSVSTCVSRSPQARLSINMQKNMAWVYPAVKIVWSKCYNLLVDLRNFTTFSDFFCV